MKFLEAERTGQNSVAGDLSNPNRTSFPILVCTNLFADIQGKLSHLLESVILLEFSALRLFLLLYSGHSFTDMIETMIIFLIADISSPFLAGVAQGPVLFKDDITVTYLLLLYVNTFNLEPWCASSLNYFFHVHYLHYTANLLTTVFAIVLLT